MNWPKIQWFKARLDPDPNEAAVETQSAAGGYDFKRWLVLGGLVCLLVVAGYTNYRLNDANGDNPATAVNPSEYGSLEDWENAQMKTMDDAEAASVPSADSTVITTLAEFALERDRVRAEEIANYDAIIDAGSDEELVYEAQKQKLALTQSMETEVTLQGLLVAKGFEGVVTVHPGTVNIVVYAEKLTEAQTARILDMAVRETGEPAGNIKIVPTKPAN